MCVPHRLGPFGGLWSSYSSRSSLGRRLITQAGRALAVRARVPRTTFYPRRRFGRTPHPLFASEAVSARCRAAPSNDRSSLSTRRQQRAWPSSSRDHGLSIDSCLRSSVGRARLELGALRQRPRLQIAPQLDQQTPCLWFPNIRPRPDRTILARSEGGWADDSQVSWPTARRLLWPPGRSVPAASGAGPCSLPRYPGSPVS